MSEENKKKSLIITAVGVCTLVLTVIGATYAYFAASIGTGSSTNVSVTSKTTDTLTFNPGSAINIVATQQNFGSGAANLSGTSTATTVLVANNTAAATYCYTANFTISANTFVHTSGTTPELTLTVTKNGTAIISNQDVTTTVSTINIPTASGGSTMKHTITAAAGATKTDTFVATVTFINLASNQQANTGKTLTAKLNFVKTTC